MPYIKPSDRVKVDKQITELGVQIALQAKSIEDRAKLTTYAIMKLMTGLYAGEDTNWYLLGDALKCVDSARDEFMQVYVRPYEKLKRIENGPI